MLNGIIKPDKGKITMRGRVGALIELGSGFNPILTGRENMITQKYKTEMLAQLDMLDNKEQKVILNLIRSLVTTKLKGVQGNKLLSFAGSIDSNDLQLMKKVIEEDCEQVNLNEW